MQLDHKFSVPVPVEQAWDVLLDIERLAPCMPGAVLDEIRGDEFDGRVKVKVGPITVTYAGTAAFVAKDVDTRTLVIRASGKEARGSGTANAVITAVLNGNGERTDVSVSTDLAITGRPAQFGRGVMAEVSNKLLGMFAESLSDKICGDREQQVAAKSPGATPGPPSERPTAMPTANPQPEAIDLFEAAGASVLKRALPALTVVLLLVTVIVRHRRR